MKRIIGLMAMAFLLSVVTAQATIYETDPADLFIGSPPKSGGYLYGSEVRPIDSDGLGILLNGQSPSTTLDSPLLLILGIPNTDTFTTLISSTDPASTVTGPVDRGNLTSGQEVYGFLGLGDGTNNSNSFTNWAAADLAVNDITADYFGIFVYSLAGADLISGHTTVDVTFASDLPLGTFAVAYGEETMENGHIRPFSTPFTEAGLTVPEPGTLLLVGAGLAALALYRRRMQ